MEARRSTLGHRARSASGRRLRNAARARPSAVRSGHGSVAASVGRAEDRRRVVPALRGEEAELHPVERAWARGPGGTAEVAHGGVPRAPRRPAAAPPSRRASASSAIGASSIASSAAWPAGHRFTQGHVAHAVEGRGGKAPGSSGVARAAAMRAASARAHASVSAASAGVNATWATRPVRR